MLDGEFSGEKVRAFAQIMPPPDNVCLFINVVINAKKQEESVAESETALKGQFTQITKPFSYWTLFLSTFMEYLSGRFQSLCKATTVTLPPSGSTCPAPMQQSLPNRGESKLTDIHIHIVYNRNHWCSDT